MDGWVLKCWSDGRPSFALQSEQENKHAGMEARLSVTLR